ncbi:MAG: DUF4230 domain-containing protein [Saprospiraceae bacterium]
MKWIINIGLVILFSLASFGLWQVYSKFGRITEKKTEESSEVLLEKIQNVMKLIAIEGQFAEIYNYKDYVGYDIWPLRKTALIRVNAKVSVGYDLNDITITKDEETKVITISKFPKAEILSIDHDLEYYDLQQGLFNVITNQDITKMSAQAKNFIEEKAQKSVLFDQVDSQKEEILKMLSYIMTDSDWQLYIEPTVDIKDLD